MASGLWIGVAAAAGALATAIAGRKVATMGQPDVDEDQGIIDAVGVAAGAPGPASGGGSGGFGPVGPVQGTPMPVSPGGPAGGFPGTFPGMGPGSTVFGFGGGRRFHTRFLFGGGGNWWGWPYYYPPAPNPEYVCQWEEVPPKEDTKMVCAPQPGAYPVVNTAVAWGPPNWGWW